MAHFRIRIAILFTGSKRKLTPSYFSFVNEKIESSSRNLNEKLSEVLTSSEKDSMQPFSLNPEKCFETSSGEPSSIDKISSSTYNVSNILAGSSPFDFSKDSSHQKEGIASIKGERSL